MTRKYISNKDESVRMFRNDFLDKFSRVHPATPLVIFLPIIGFFVYRTADDGIGFSRAVSLVLLGLFVWTLTEYSLHRFVFHYVPKSEWGKRVHFIFHGVHHDYPSDSWRLVMVPTVSLPLAALFFVLYYKLLGSVDVSPFFAGFLSGYLFYDMTHYAIHHLPMKNRFFLFLKKYHAKHHYQDEDRGYGVSQPMWDYVFNTRFKG